MMKRHPRPIRRAFTLVELMVVIAILAILAALAAAGIMNWVSGQARRNSESHIRSVFNALSRQWDQVISDAKKEALPDNVTRSDLISARLIEAFPVSFQEIQTAYTASGNPLLLKIPKNRQKYMANYQKAISVSNAVVRQPKTESAACLLLALAIDRSGGGYNPDSFKAFIKDVDGDGIAEFVDGWGEPLYFYRFPTGTINTDMIANRPATTILQTNNLPIPIVVSAGADGKLGLPNPPSQDTTITSTLDENDNIYSYKIK